MEIRTNVFRFNTDYQRSKQGLANSMTRLASGDKLSVVGQETPDVISLSQRFRAQIKGAEASKTAIHSAIEYLNTADTAIQTSLNILQRMYEIAEFATDGLHTSANRTDLEVEFQELKQELTAMNRRNTFMGNQTTGKDAILSFDGNTEKMRFWQSNGDDETYIERDFSAVGRDAEFNLIEFDSTEAYSMSRDGDSLFYLTHVAGDGAGTVRMKRYDIETNRAYTGNTLFNSQDTMFVDQQFPLGIFKRKVKA